MGTNALSPPATRRRFNGLRQALIAGAVGVLGMALLAPIPADAAASTLGAAAQQSGRYDAHDG